MIGWKKEVREKYTLFTHSLDIESGGGASEKIQLVHDAQIVPAAEGASSIVEIVESRGTSIVQLNGSSAEIGEAVTWNFTISPEDLELVKNVYDQIDGGNYRCSLCGYLSNDSNAVVAHIIYEHQDWKNSIAQSSQKTSTSACNIFENSNWKSILKQNFQAMVIDKCSEDTRIAWNQNKDVAIMPKYVEIRTEILKKLAERIFEMHGTGKTPSQSDLEDIVNDCLTRGYPKMFGEANTKRGYGAGGANPNKQLPKQLKARIFAMQLRLREEVLREDGQVSQDVDASQRRNGAKKGRTGDKYGTIK